MIGDPLADSAGLDGEGAGVDEMLQGTFDTDTAGMNGAAVSSEMRSFFILYKYQSRPKPVPLSLL